MIEQRTTRITKFRVVPWEDILWPSDGLVSWWKLNGNANDAWGTNHGTAYGVIWLPKGAASFDGVDDYVEIRNFEPDLTEKDWSITAWIKAGTQSIAARIYGPEGGFGEWARLVLTPARVLSVEASTDDGVTRIEVISAGPWDDNQWHFVAWVADATEIRLYIDGNLEGSDVNNLPAGTVVADYFPIGCRREVDKKEYSLFFNGIIDEVRIYNRALSADEVKKCYLKTRIVPLKVGV